MLPLEQLARFSRRLEEVNQLLCDPQVLADTKRVTELGRERGRLEPLVETFTRYKKISQQIQEDREALSDPELGAMVQEELPGLLEEKAEIERQLAVLLLPRDPSDERNTVLEIRAGTGGEEAALFAHDLFRMYCRFAETRGWKVEILSQSEASAGGIKEVIALVSGQNVYSQLKFESGVHRVQR